MDDLGAIEVRNPGHEDRFTCPGCGLDFWGPETTCPNEACCIAIECEVQQQPVAVCRRKAEEDDASSS